MQPETTKPGDSLSLPSSQALSSGDADVARGEVGKAIFILGPSSSGKTTLCNALAKDLQLDDNLYVREVARRVMTTQGFTRDDTGTYEMQAAIMRAQLQAEVDVLRNADTAAFTGKVFLLSDRSAVDPIVYASTSSSLSGGARSKLLDDRAFHVVLPLYRRSIFVVLHPIKDWVKDDGIRSLEDPWVYLEELFQTLRQLKIPYIEVEDSVRDLQQRVSLVRSHLRASDG